jgi:hypothetical protein
MRKFIILFMMIPGAFACNDDGIPGDSVDFYALTDYQTQGPSMKIIESSVILSDSLIIPYNEIIYYRSKTHTFFITEHLSDILSDFEEHPLGRKPFALVADGELIYTGYFWYGFMSSGCDWVVIDPIDYSGENKITVRLGYPGLIDGDQIPDKRNDPRLLRILKKDRKLID